MQRIRAALAYAGLCAALAGAEAHTAEKLAGDAVSIAGKETSGIVLLAVRWDRRWGCAGFENAQLRAVSFDRLPSGRANDDAVGDIVLADAPLIMTKPVFENYALLVEPGEYGLSRLEIKVARSRSDVGSFKASRSVLLKDPQTTGGTFTVAAGEVVYVGHFYLDCAAQHPVLWRFYPEGREAFSGYLASLKKIYPALDTEKVVFRLFQTKQFGNDYKLP